MEGLASVKSRGAGPVLQHYFFFNFNPALTITIWPPISMGSQSQQKLWCEKSFLRNPFCPVFAASISEEQVCCEASVVIVIYYRKPEKA